MQTQSLTTSEGAPPILSLSFLRAARPSRELIARLTADADAARVAGRVDDALFLLDVALAARLAGRGS
jgi:hypothetical protein